MSSVIAVDFRQSASVIDVSQVTRRRVLDATMIKPATQDIPVDLAIEHASEPIKNLDDIQRISAYLVGKERYRDNMLFIVGINFGLRCSDLIQLRFCNLINDDFSFKVTFPILEKKTRNTRKVAKNRYITINDAVMDAVTLYLTHCPGKTLSDYMFTGEGNRSVNSGKPLTVYSVERILKGIAKDLGLTCKVATHTLRKTFGYHQMVMGGNDPRRLLLLQKMFGHATAAQTLDYIGITGEEIQEAYLGLNLGGKNPYAVFNGIAETVA